MTNDRFAQMAMDGWDGIATDDHGGALQADMQKVMNEALREAIPIADVLETPEGQHMLRWLISKTLTRPVSELEANAKTIEEYALLKARREGQNGVVMMLMQTLHVAKLREG